MGREADVERFYELVADLETRVGGMRKLGDCTGYMDWPDRGVYFFFAPEERTATSDQRRLTRVGTHAVSAGSSTTLWDRLRTHRGAKSGTYEGGGNHRGSVFRKRVGEAMIHREKIADRYPHWGEGSSAARDRRLSELEHERRVSEYIRDLPFLWVKVDDEAGPASNRAYIEQNAIALISNFERKSINPRSEGWLGNASPSQKIRQSGLWNVNHVDEEYDPAFLDGLMNAIEGTDPL